MISLLIQDNLVFIDSNSVSHPHISSPKLIANHITIANLGLQKHLVIN